MDILIETPTGYTIVSADHVKRANYEFPSIDAASESLYTLQNGELPKDLTNFLVNTYELEEVSQQTECVHINTTELQGVDAATGKLSNLPQTVADRDSSNSQVFSSAESQNAAKVAAHIDSAASTSSNSQVFNSAESLNAAKMVAHIDSAASTSSNSQVFSSAESQNAAKLAAHINSAVVNSVDGLTNSNTTHLVNADHLTAASTETDRVSKSSQYTKSYIVPEKHRNTTIVCGDKRLSTAISKTLNLTAIEDFLKYKEAKSAAQITVDSSVALAVAHRIAGKCVSSPNTVDFIIHQLVDILGSLDEELNLKTMRVKEWYGTHFPELEAFLTDNYKFLKAACIVGVRDTFVELMESQSIESVSFSECNYEIDSLPDSCKDLQPNCRPNPQTNQDSAEQSEQRNTLPTSTHTTSAVTKTCPFFQSNFRNTFKNTVLALRNELNLTNNQITQLKTLASMSIGLNITQSDFAQIHSAIKSIFDLLKNKQNLVSILETRMSSLAPNATALIGFSVASKILSKLGSLVHCAKAPASTLQIVGAEKAYFEAVKNKQNTPKFGFIFHSNIVQNAPLARKGAVARSLSTKLALCFRVDCYGKSDCSYGVKAREALVRRLASVGVKKVKKDTKLGKMVFEKKLVYDSSKDSANSAVTGSSKDTREDSAKRRKLTSDK